MTTSGPGRATLPQQSGSEDFSNLFEESATPYHYWAFGGIDPLAYRRAEKDSRNQHVPVNHSPAFAPVVHPTLSHRTRALVVATPS
jgi:hippurate hydrolase